MINLKQPFYTVFSKRIIHFVKEMGLYNSMWLVCHVYVIPVI